MASRKQRPQAFGPVTAADVIAFIEPVCFVPEGKFVGQPLKLQDWQKDILRLIYDNESGPTRRAIVSMGRKNAKTRWPHVCFSPICAARRPATSPIRNCILPLSRAIKRRSSLAWRAKWCA